MASRGTPPGRRITGGSAVKSSTVDSTPTGVGPASSTSSMRPAKSAITWSAVVGLGRPNRFALGAAMGVALARISASATGCVGIRTATVGRPAVTRSGMQSALGSTSVSGPGISVCTSRSAAGGSDFTTPRSCSTSATCTISGSQVGRSFASKIHCTALGLSASAPSPYTVYPTCHLVKSSRVCGYNPPTHTEVNHAGQNHRNLLHPRRLAPHTPPSQRPTSQNHRP
jgi:hypothetical protein